MQFLKYLNDKFEHLYNVTELARTSIWSFVRHLEITFIKYSAKNNQNLPVHFIFILKNSQQA